MTADGGGLFGGGVSARALLEARHEGAEPSAPAAHGSAWSPEEDARLRELWPGGGATTAATLMGRSLIAVIERARRIGLGSPNKALVSLTEVARRAGCSRERVRRGALAYGVPRVGYARSDARRADGHRWSGLPENAARQLVRRLATAPSRILRNRAGSWGLGRKPRACLDPHCRHPNRPHYARGRCKPCYQRLGRCPSLASAAAPGLTNAERSVLSLLGTSRRPLGVRELAARTGRFREQVGRIVRDLTARGFVAVAREARARHPRYVLSQAEGAP